MRLLASMLLVGSALLVAQAGSAQSVTPGLSITGLDRDAPISPAPEVAPTGPKCELHILAATDTGSFSYSAWTGLLQNVIELAKKGDRMAVYTSLASGVIIESIPHRLSRALASNTFHLPPNLDVIIHEPSIKIPDADLKKRTRNFNSQSPCYAELFINNITIISVMQNKAIDVRLTYKAFHSNINEPYIFSKRSDNHLAYFPQNSANDVQYAKNDIESAWAAILYNYANEISQFERSVSRD